MSYRDIPPYNRRSGLMWAAILMAVDFTGKSVVDLGCGYGDFLWQAFMAGAKRVLGIDKDPAIVKAVRFRLEAYGYAIAPVSAVIGNLDALADGEDGLVPQADIALCFSVLPYLKDPEGFLRFMAQNFPMSVIECQYWGDGPGPAHLKNDADMSDWLLNFWTAAEKIGSTPVPDRGAVRSIWRCR